MRESRSQYVPPSSFGKFVYLTDLMTFWQEPFLTALQGSASPSPPPPPPPPSPLRAGSPSPQSQAPPTSLSISPPAYAGSPAVPPGGSGFSPTQQVAFARRPSRARCHLLTNVLQTCYLVLISVLENLCLLLACCKASHMSP